MPIQKNFRLFYTLTIFQLVLFLTYCLSLLNKKIPFFASDVDPEYEYLDNALKILYGITPGHADHPGATLQFLLAIFFIFFRIIFKHGESFDYRLSYVKNPESYAVGYVTFLLIILSVILFFVIKKFKEENTSLIFTTYPFVLLLVLSGQVGMLVRLNPESLLILISTLLLLQILSTKEFLEYKDIKYKHILITSLILAAGVATKITFLPMFVLVLFIRGFKRKIFLIISASFFLILLVLPQRGTFSVTWFFNIFLNPGRVGQKRENGRSFNQIQESLIDLWTVQYPFVGGALFVFAVLYMIPKWNFKTQHKHLSYILAVLILSGSFLVVRETIPRDFSHLAPFGALFLLIIASKIFKDIEIYFFSNIKKIPIAATVIFLIFIFFNFAAKLDRSFMNIRHVILNNADATDIQMFPGYEFDEVSRSLMNDKNFVISQYTTPSEFAGLQFGDLYHGEGFLSEYIYNKFPYGLEFNIFDGYIYNALNDPVGCSFIWEAQRNGSHVYIHSYNIEDTLQRINRLSYRWDFYGEDIEINNFKLYKLRLVKCV